MFEIAQVTYEQILTGLGLCSKVQKTHCACVGKDGAVNIEQLQNRSRCGLRRLKIADNIIQVVYGLCEKISSLKKHLNPFFSRTKWYGTFKLYIRK